MSDEPGGRVGVEPGGHVGGGCGDGAGGDGVVWGDGGAFVCGEEWEEKKRRGTSRGRG